MPDPVRMLKDDHAEVKQLFAEFEGADGRSRPRISHEAMKKLEVHTMLEEEIFYPAMQAERDVEGLMAEAEEEHHVAKMLINELKGMERSSDATTYDAKFTVLAESVRHHIQEEEREMLPRAKELGRDRLEELGSQMERRKEDLMAQLPEPGSRRGQ